MKEQSTIFISDIHLGITDSLHIANFIKFLQHMKKKNISIYILGDLFNFWAGNSQARVGVIRTLLKELKSYSKNAPLYFLGGNRDFLFSHYWEKKNGQVIDDGSIINAGKKQIMLFHGDCMCTHDIQYQKVRRILQSKIVHFLSCFLPTSFALAIGRKLRNISKETVSKKKSNILKMDIDYMKKLLKEKSCKIMICGHAHIQKTIAFDFGTNSYKIFILPESSINIFNYLVLENERFSFQSFKV